MSINLAALAPTSEESLVRGLADLRMGLPCQLSDDATQVVIAAVETLTPDRFAALGALFGTPQLVLSHHRGRVVLPKSAGSMKAPDVNAAPLRIRPPDAAGLEWFRRLADPAQDTTAGPRGPLHVLQSGDTALAALALRLVKLAELLPAILLFPLPQGTSFTLPDMARIDVAAVTDHLAAAPAFSPVSSAFIPFQASDHGQLHVFRDPSGHREHYAVEIGAPDRGVPVLARLHSACFTGDVLGSLKCDCGPQLRAALAQMGVEGAGLLLYLNQEGRGIGLANKMRVYDLQAQGFDTVEANHRLGFDDDERDFRIAAVMLRHLGFGAARLLTNNPAKTDVFRKQGITITEQLPVRVVANAHNRHYLATKALKSGHAL